MEANINIHLGKLEVRRYKGFNDESLDPPKNKNMHEFVKWEVSSDEKPYCYVVAFAEQTSEGFDIRTVGDRPWRLNSCDFEDYNKLVKAFFACCEAL